MELGAGRASKDDLLDLGVGIKVRVQVGDPVKAGQELLTLCCNERDGNPLPADWITLSDEPCAREPWLLEVVEQG
jgi:pyrimidine-nucleoside phosphorylase